MNQTRDDWDGSEREAFEGLEEELSEIRRRHEGDPSLDLLRAAAADALPPTMQARLDQHLRDSQWSRVLVAGLRDANADIQLDAETEQRLFERITREAAAAVPHRRRWSPVIAFGGLAAAATLIIAVVVSRQDRTIAPEISPAPLSRAAAPATDQAAPAATPLPASEAQAPMAFTKPEVTLSPSALTWRGDPSANPFLHDLAPAFEAYRSGNYAKAAGAFDRLSVTYPEAIEVLFYQGVSHMLAGDDAGSIPPLEAAVRLGNPAFADDVAWFLAVARQRSGQAGAAPGFATLCRGQGKHAAEACEAAKRITSSPRPR